MTSILDTAHKHSEAIGVYLGNGATYSGPVWKSADGSLFVMYQNKPVSIEWKGDRYYASTERPVAIGDRVRVCSPYSWAPDGGAAGLVVGLNERGWLGDDLVLVEFSYGRRFVFHPTELAIQ